MSIQGKDLSLKKLKEGYTCYCTVGRLKEFIKDHNVPDDAKILIQRVPDYQYINNNWSTVKKEGDHYNSYKRFIDRIKKDTDKTMYPDISDDERQSLMEQEKELHLLMDEYTPVWSPVKYKDDDENLYLDMMY